ncbi:MAG: hypothetical protein ACRD3L_12565, partial [Terriglobales bacterium]
APFLARSVREKWGTARGQTSPGDHTARSFIFTCHSFTRTIQTELTPIPTTSPLALLGLLHLT